MDDWWASGISCFLLEETVSFLSVAIVYYFLDRYYKKFINFFFTFRSKLFKLKPLQYKVPSHFNRTDLPAKGEKPEIHYYLGEAYLRSGMLEAAKKELQTALYLDLHLFNGRPYTRLAECYLREGNHEKALQMLDKAVDWFPSLNTLCETGELYRISGEKEKARRIFDQVIQGYKEQLKYRRRKEWRWLLFALLRNFNL
ncbi:hypothetical protein Tfer_0010 [Thermincola ferriacetica]|uniref:Uncharacterized protein n=1 Tax=Thermincola ferriacetica TaxID=281456 RepID=A0A0L6W6F6_9FIRM|nr:tetratricopeptide repeat protein [Thermincola ferriacetica]KNZ70948.1 hypothetical protein Tfer_0010 [Thermincola ferriacetica]